MSCPREVFFRRVQCHVQAAERRAAVAGNVAGGVQPGADITFLLQHGQAGERLHAVEVDAAALHGVLVIERDVAQRRRAAAVYVVIHFGQCSGILQSGW
jgi:hypothetical protein